MPVQLLTEVCVLCVCVYCWEIESVVGSDGGCVNSGSLSTFLDLILHKYFGKMYKFMDC